MKIIRIAIFTLTILINSFTLSEAQTVSQTLPPKDFKHMLEKTAGVLIDVRSSEEYNYKHIPDAINMNIDAEDFKTQIAKLDKNKFYFLYCGIGKRSERAMEMMKEAGFKKLYNLKGGFTDWKREGLPIVQKEKE